MVAYYNENIGTQGRAFGATVSMGEEAVIRMNSNGAKMAGIGITSLSDIGDSAGMVYLTFSPPSALVANTALWHAADIGVNKDGVIGQSPEKAELIAPVTAIKVVCSAGAYKVEVVQ